MVAFLAGQKIRASDLNFLAPLISYKTSNQTVTNSTTLTNDTAIFFTPGINTVWKVDGTIHYQATSAGDFKLAFTWPAGATFGWGLCGVDTAGNPGAAAFDVTAASGSPFAVGGTGAGMTLQTLISGVLVMSSTAGNLQFQFAQFIAAAATSAICMAGSTLVATRLA